MEPTPIDQGHNDSNLQNPEWKENERKDFNPAKGLDKAISLLQANDDTARFVGLALLKSMLDNHAELRDSKETVTRCWKAIPATFLDRLLMARASEKTSKEDAQNMIGLAVAVVHAFLTLLPPGALEYDRFKAMLAKMTAAEACRYIMPSMIIMFPLQLN